MTIKVVLYIALTIVGLIVFTYLHVRESLKDIGIYSFTIKEKIIYIGQSKVLNTRLNTHYNKLRQGIHENKLLQHLYNVHKNNFSDNIILNCYEDRLNKIEAELISTHEPSCNTYLK